MLMCYPQPRMSTKNFAAIATQFCKDTLAGAIPSGKWTKLACQRHLDDLKKQETDPSWAYYFDEKKFTRVCKFVELCPHVKGKKFVGKNIHLEPWQVFLLTAFGWFHKETKVRRFKRSYCEVAKGNAKSTLSAALCLYFAFVDGEPGSEVYAAATTRDQAKVVFSVSQAMARAMPQFRERAGIEVSAHSIHQLSTNSFFRPVSSEANSIEGVLPFFTVVDELHAHNSRDMYDNLDTANSKRPGSMLWAITTAGDNRAGICYEVRNYLTKVLSGVVDDDTVFGCIWSIDDDDDPFAGPEVWRKANPNLDVSVDPAEIGAKAHAAMQLASKQPSFKTKHLNCWVSADHAWMDLVRWSKCADSTLDEDDFAEQPCILGLDLASKLDILALVKIFWKDDQPDGKRHYYCFGCYWTPEERIEQTANSQYRGWVIEGRLQTCRGETNDYNVVEDYIREACKKYQVVEVAHDPYQAVELVNHLAEEGIVMTEIPQMPKYLSEPMKEMEAAVYDGRFHFNGDPILTWAMSNVVCHPDRNDNLFPVKEHKDNKIDPATALLTGMNRVMAQAAHNGGSGIDAFGPCHLCGQLAIGAYVNSLIVFRCPSHP